VKTKIGIDPGKQTGIAIMRDGKLSMMYTTDFWKCHDEIVCMPSCEVEIHIEDTNDLPVFHDAPNMDVKGAIGKRVGGVCREANLLIERFRSLGYTVVVHNNKKSPKLDAKQFARLTGWKWRTSQHSRDAAMLVI
jgi:hypothetical protein